MGEKIFTSPPELRKFVHPHVEKYLQVHVDLENFFTPCQKYLQDPVENHKYCIRKNKCKKIFTSPPGLRKFVHPHVKNIYKSTWT